MEFSAGSCIRFGWETFKKRPWFLIGSFLLYMVVVGVAQGSLQEIGKAGPALNFLSTVLTWIFDILIGMAMTAFLLKAHDDIEHVALIDFWRFQPFWYFFGAQALVFLVVIGGLILLVVPGIIWGLMFSFASYLVIDRGFSPMEAMRESKRITYGYKWMLLWLGVLMALVVLLGLVCLIVGIFVAIPVVSIANVHAMRELQKRAKPVPATI